MRFDVVLKGGRVFDPVHHVDERLDIGIREGRIAELEKELPHGEETYDVSGLTVIVLPWSKGHKQKSGINSGF